MNVNFRMLLKITTFIAFSAGFKAPLFFLIAHIIVLPQTAWQTEENAKLKKVPFCHIKHQLSNTQKKFYLGL